MQFRNDSDLTAESSSNHVLTRELLLLTLWLQQLSCNPLTSFAYAHFNTEHLLLPISILRLGLSWDDDTQLLSKAFKERRANGFANISAAISVAGQYLTSIVPMVTCDLTKLPRIATCFAPLNVAVDQNIEP